MTPIETAPGFFQGFINGVVGTFQKIGDTLKKVGTDVVYKAQEAYQAAQAELKRLEDEAKAEADRAAAEAVKVKDDVLDFVERPILAERNERFASMILDLQAQKVSVQMAFPDNGHICEITLVDPAGKVFVGTGADKVYALESAIELLKKPS